MDNEYFTFKDGIITVKISSDMSNRTVLEIIKIKNLLNNILPKNCHADIDLTNGIMYFYDQYDRFPIDEHFDTTIY
jgi:hypothetical protein